MTDYGEYLRTEGLDRGRARLASSMALTDQMLQSIKNQSAPTISGGGGSGSSGGGGAVNGGVWSGPVKLGSMKGGKVAPIKGARISQGWGKSNIRYAAGRHTGMDFGVKSGTRVGSAAAGTVIRTGSEGAYGNAIHVRQNDGSTALYAHLSGINVKPGQKVKAGQQIGKSGNTGRSTGAHLHFEIRKQDKYGGDVNPQSWFSTR